MPRNLTNAMLAAITAPSFNPAILVRMQFAAPGSSPTTINIWSGSGTLSYSFAGATSWLGMGKLLSLGQVEDGSTVEARGMSIGLSGLDTTLLPDALTELQLGLPATIWLAAMSGGVPVNYPAILWSGAMDQPHVEIGPESCELTIDLENLLVSQDVPVDRRLTPQDQQMTYPGDQGLQFVYSIIDVALVWGSIGKGAAGSSQGSNAI